jgi:hypothetical protein
MKAFRRLHGYAYYVCLCALLGHSFTQNRSLKAEAKAVVRQLAVQVWKSVGSVTARTLREILSVLVDQIVTALTSGDPERTQVAGRCSGDYIVEKLGD